MKLFLKILLTFFLSSCGTMSLYTQAISSIKNSFINNELTITDEIKKLPYAMQLITLHGDQSILVLKDVDGDNLSWVDSSNEGFTTYFGKIIKTNGFDNDFRLINPPNLKEISLILNASQEQNKYYKTTGFIRFLNPDTTFLSISYHYEIVQRGVTIHPISLRKIPHILIQEKIMVPTLSWKDENYYWIDMDGNLLKSKIQLFPNSNRIHTTTIKSYSK